MTWRRTAIAVCATVAALAGTVSVVANAVAADHEPPGVVSSPGEGATSSGTTSPYRSSLTITLDKLTESCPPRPDATPTQLPSPTSCSGQVQLSVGASEQEVIRALGEPLSRRTLSATTETWSYTWQNDSQGLQELAETTLRFDGHRLVDAQEYVFK